MFYTVVERARKPSNTYKNCITLQIRVYSYSESVSVAGWVKRGGGRSSASDERSHEEVACEGSHSKRIQQVDVCTRCKRFNVNGLQRLRRGVYYISYNIHYSSSLQSLRVFLSFSSVCRMWWKNSAVDGRLPRMRPRRRIHTPRNIPAVYNTSTCTMRGGIA